MSILRKIVRVCENILHFNHGKGIRKAGNLEQVPFLKCYKLMAVHISRVYFAFFYRKMPRRTTKISSEKK